MPAQARIVTLLRSHLSEDAAEAMLDKIGKMASQKKSAEEIQKAFTADLNALMQELATQASECIRGKDPLEVINSRPRPTRPGGGETEVVESRPRPKPSGLRKGPGPRSSK